MVKFIGLESLSQIFFSVSLFLVLIKLYIDSFSSIIFSHTRRLYSSASHNLVRHVKHVSGLYVWI